MVSLKHVEEKWIIKYAKSNISFMFIYTIMNISRIFVDTFQSTVFV